MSTKTLISTITVGGGGAASIDFTSIPATYDDLVLEVSGKSTSSGPWNLRAQFNGDTGSNYSTKYLQGTGSAVSSGSVASTYIYCGEVPGSDATSVFSNTEIYIPNYLSANYKSVSIDAVQEQNTAAAYANLNAVLWSSASAINAIHLFLASGNFAQYSMASLYGIKAS